MKSTQNKMINSSCGTKNDEMARNSTRNSTVDSSTKNQGDLREIRNQGDLRDVTDRGGNADRINMTRS